MDGSHCPACRKDIGYWAIYKAGLPTLVRCPHCKAQLKYNPPGWKAVIISILVSSLVLAPLFFYLQTYFSLNSELALLAVLFLAVLIWLPLEIYLVHKLRNDHQLVLRK